MESSDNVAPVPVRLPGLDVLRAIAVLLVLGNHMWMWSVPSAWPRSLAWCFEAWQRGGWIGVDLFFVLSGFLVSGLLFTDYRTRGRLAIGRFYVRRGWKIYPPFYVLIGATLVAHLLLRMPIPLRALPPELLFLQNYLQGIWGHTWSLAVEEHFYLLLPLLLWAILRGRPGVQDPFARVLPLMIGVIAIVELVLRWVNVQSYDTYSHRTHLFSTHLRLDSLFFGVLLAYWYHFHPERFAAIQARWRRGLLVVGLVLLVPPFLFDREEHIFLSTIGLTMNALGAGFVLVALLSLQLSQNWLLRSLAGIGRNSYSIYLWHMPVILWGIPQCESLSGIDFGSPVRVVLAVSGSVLVGIMMAQLIEVPVLRLRNRWFPAQSSTSVPAPTQCA